MEKNLEMSMLLDIYGSLLTEKQRETLEFYYDDDLSLGEISEETVITRQGVFNCIKKTEDILRDFEEKLGLAKRFQTLQKDIEELERLIFSAQINNENEIMAIDEKLVEIKSRL